MSTPHQKEPMPSSPRLQRTVALVGLMGAGKSAIGKRVAAAIGAAFSDADDEIERAAGMSISDIFRVHGEAAFRDGERRVIARLLAGPPLILATGGGAFMDAETRRVMLDSAATVWLKADLDTLVRRCARRDNRPLLRGGNMRDTLSMLMDERYPVYATAHATVISEDGPHEQGVAAVISALRSLGAIREENV